MDVRHPRASLAAFLLLAALSVGFFLWMCSPYVLPVLMGEILALLLVPVHRRMSARLPPKLSSAAATVGLLLLVIVPVGFFASLAGREGSEVVERLAHEGDVMDRAHDWLDRAERSLGVQPRSPEQNRNAAETALKTASVAAVGLARALPGAALQLGLALLSCFFFLLDEGRLPLRLLSRLPVDDDLKLDLFETIRSTAVTTLLAGLAAAVSQASVVLAGFLLLRIPAAFLAAGATFICAWIPMVGIMPASAAAALYLAATGHWARLAGLAVVVAAAGTVDNVVRPMVLKSGNRLHPLLSLVAIFGGIKLFGIAGVFLGPVLAAIVVALYDVWPSVARRYGIALDGR